ncbi:endolytic transglycosylase MltG [Rhodococcus globerulus]|uniref:endolytic transglycosylase MltG n=1 Tax=Rhodococcus globerulus TaxID=33008 RepID=UPI001F176B5E|nr:endolytic transglycosylase MltG [Rhodococcus globerulus]MCE4263503.1 endolytic transglycosylase MltG [Rhodococcus globerulus]
MSGRWDEGGSGRPTGSFDFDNDETMVMRALPQTIEPPHMSRAEARKQREAQSKRAKRGKKVGVLALLVLVIAVLGVGAYGATWYMNRTQAAADYAGPGGAPVVIQILPGETASEIGATLAEKDVVASSAAFYNAAVSNSAEIQKVQPGFYQVPVQSSAAEALDTLVAPESRVGLVVVAAGRQLHDSSDAQTGALKKGIYNLIEEASCVGSASAQTCVTADELNTAGASSDLAALGVPSWAMLSVQGVPDKDRQLEGLIAASSWDFDPTGTPTEILRTLVQGSAEKYESTGILTAGSGVGLSPYQLLVAASLVEREALPDDMSKVARVIVNRLAVDQPLQFDSTVNYSLDTTEVATTDDDRARVTPWNTYAMPGLPATPIASPSIEALQAVESPALGDWLYFVTINMQGETLFTHSYDEHLANIVLAQESGILDSGR